MVPSRYANRATLSLHALYDLCKISLSKGFDDQINDDRIGFLF